MAHSINLLAGRCTLRNHFNCDHDVVHTYSLAGIPRHYISILPADTAQYLNGWSTVAGLDEDDASMLWLMLEADGANNDMERGVRDGLEAAFGA